MFRTDVPTASLSRRPSPCPRRDSAAKSSWPDVRVKKSAAHDSVARNVAVHARGLPLQTAPQFIMGLASSRDVFFFFLVLEPRLHASRFVSLFPVSKREFWCARSPAKLSMRDFTPLNSRRRARTSSFNIWISSRRSPLRFVPSTSWRLRVFVDSWEDSDGFMLVMSIGLCTIKSFSFSGLVICRWRGRRTEVFRENSIIPHITQYIEITRRIILQDT